jgi:hypothetical protein
VTWEAPAGIPWLVWLIVVLLVGPPSLGSKAAAKIPGLLGVTGRWWQKRKAAEVSMGELARIRLELRALRRDWDEQVPALQKRVDALEAQLTRTTRRLWAALDHIRTLTELLRRHAPGIPIPDPPEELHEDA